MRYTNAGFIGSGVVPKKSGEVDGIWRYFTDINKAIVSDQWYRSTVPENINILPNNIYEEIGTNVTISGFFSNDTAGFSETFQWEESSDMSIWVGIDGAIEQNYSLSVNNEQDIYLRLKIFRGFKSGLSNNITIVNGINIGYNVLSIDYQSPFYEYDPSSTGIIPGGCSAYMSLNASASRNTDPALNFEPKYQWQKKESENNNFFDMQGETNSSLNISNITYENDNEDMYRCVVTAKGAFPVTGATYIIYAQQSSSEPNIPQPIGSISFGSIYFDWDEIDTSNGYFVSDHDFVWQSGDGSTWSEDNLVSSIGNSSDYFFYESLENNIYYRAKIRAKGINDIGCNWISNYGQFSDPVLYNS